MMETNFIIRTKRAVRNFTDQAVTAEDQMTILEAGRRAPSAMNRQPWSFVAVTERARLETLAGISGHSAHLAGAAFAVLILIPEGHWPVFDAGQAAAYMQLAAWDRGIASCVGSFVDPVAVRDILGYPPELSPVCCISFGYPLQAAEGPARKGGRKSLEEIAHWNSW